MNQQKYDLFKVILFGDQGSGKSSILCRYTQKKFQEQYLCTLGVDLKTKYIQSNYKPIKLQIWDTSGKQQFKAISNSYLNVYDCQNIQSFQKVYKLFQTIQSLAPQNTSKWLVANKSNQYSSKVSTEQGIERAKQLGYQFMQVSAKNNYNIDKLFENAIDQAFKKIKS